MRLHRIVYNCIEKKILNLSQHNINYATWVTNLINLSNAINHIGITSAQGIRVLQNFQPQQLNEFKKNASNKNLTTLLKFLQTFFQINDIKTTKLISLNYNMLLDNHFLFNTMLNKTTKTDHNLSNTNIHFIRTQRRYNKRRYARVRAVSRPSFWAGMTISTTAIGMF